MNLLCDPIMLKFEREISITGTLTDGEQVESVPMRRREIVLEADLVELYTGFAESLGQNRFYHQAAKPFAGWLKKQFNVDVSLTQAETIARVVDQEYGAYKKKFDNGQTLPQNSESPLSDSTKD